MLAVRSDELYLVSLWHEVESYTVTITVSVGYPVVVG